MVASYPTSLDLMYVLGMALWAQQKNDEAIDVYRAVLAIQPDYPGVAQLIEAIGGSKP